MQRSVYSIVVVPAVLGVTAVAASSLQQHHVHASSALVHGHSTRAHGTCSAGGRHMFSWGHQCPYAAHSARGHGHCMCPVP